MILSMLSSIRLFLNSGMKKPQKLSENSVLMWQDGKITEDALRPLSTLEVKGFGHHKVAVLLCGGTASILKTSPSLRILR